MLSERCERVPARCVGRHAGDAIADASTDVLARDVVDVVDGEQLLDANTDVLASGEISPDVISLHARLRVRHVRKLLPAILPLKGIQMPRYRLTAKSSGHEMGIYVGKNVVGAVNAMSKDAGYKNSADQARTLEISLAKLFDDLVIEELPPQRKARNG